ncbi:hypothetical protein ACIBCO_02080 [Streptomyces violascens]|uniref:hypothetical protein n=1 Tax=Streptomyces violascens TaxID=67381 RepID=UPI00379AEF43
MRPHGQLGSPATDLTGGRRRGAGPANSGQRHWATPDSAGPERDALWRELYAAGIDWFNADDLAGLETFLRAHGA